MMDWANDFLERCLSGIPEGKYERRLQKELEGHLAALETDLTAAGYAPEEARAEAVRRMGDPAALNRDYLAQWLRRPERLGYDFLTCFRGSLWAGVWYVGAFLLLGLIGFAYDRGDIPFPMLSSNPSWRIIAGIVMFLCAYLADAAFLRRTFRGRKRKRLLITLGLLLAWVCEKGVIMLISTLLYGFLPLPELMYRIAYGGDQSAPWFKYYYLIWTFCACFPLGWLFGGGEKEKRRLAA